IMGVPARHVFILGAPDCIPLVKRIAELCDDPVDEIHLERKSPLKAGETLHLDELKPSDAVIAFSRREVLDLRAELMARRSSTSRREKAMTASLGFSSSRCNVSPALSGLLRSRWISSTGSSQSSAMRLTKGMQSGAACLHPRRAGLHPLGQAHRRAL
ncbi:P-loop NTPase family protein, partial [Gluconobacter kondonii]|uniref:hypothetical protein n=1 Tax=Gluconobacter kondonii TaxID=941463 RepID=UPI001F12178E